MRSMKRWMVSEVTSYRTLVTFLKRKKKAKTILMGLYKYRPFPSSCGWWKRVYLRSTSWKWQIKLIINTSNEDIQTNLNAYIYSVKSTCYVFKGCVMYTVVYCQELGRNACREVLDSIFLSRKYPRKRNINRRKRGQTSVYAHGRSGFWIHLVYKSFYFSFRWAHWSAEIPRTL